MPACSALTSRTINALRFPCAVLVVLIHLFKPVPEETFPYGFFRTLEIAFSDGLARIAVPIFFFISGFLFFLSKKSYNIETSEYISEVYDDKGKELFTDFYRVEGIYIEEPVDEIYYQKEVGIYCNRLFKISTIFLKKGHCSI